MTDVTRDEIDALLATDMARIAGAAAGAVMGAHIVEWRRLPNEKAADEWRMLREWVEWFTIRYHVPLSTVPNCWWRHDALVEELSALHSAHLAAFDASDSGFGPIGWHERLALAMPRLTRAGVGCTSEHQGIRPRSWVGSTDEAEWDAWIEQTHAHGDTAVSHNRKEER